MRRRIVTVSAFVIVAGIAALVAQGNESPAAQPPPDQIFYNAKVVTVDDASFRPATGTILQALAVRGDTIVATGSDGEVRALAGPKYDPGRSQGTHAAAELHPHARTSDDWAWTAPVSLQHVFPEGNPHLVVRFLKGTAEEQIASWEKTLTDAVSVAKPGQWILLSSDFGGNFENMPVLFAKFLKGITKARLDELAPNNPVRVKNSWIDGLLNTRGIEAIRKVFPNAQLEGRGNRSESGRQLEPDVILGNKTELNAQLLKAEMQLWTAHGVTTFGSSPYAPGNFKALAWLDARKEMPARFAWGYSGPDLHFDTLRMVAGMLGHGSEHRGRNREAAARPSAPPRR